MLSTQSCVLWIVLESLGLPAGLLDAVRQESPFPQKLGL